MMVLFTVLSLKYQIMYNLAFSYRFQESLFYSLEKRLGVSSCMSKRISLHAEAFYFNCFINKCLKTGCRMSKYFQFFFFVLNKGVLGLRKKGTFY